MRQRYVNMKSRLSRNFKLSGIYRNKQLLSCGAQNRRPTGPRAFFKKFQQDESGVATVDFVIITTIAVIFGAGMAQAALNGTRAFATDVVAALGANQPSVVGTGNNGDGNGGSSSGGSSSGGSSSGSGSGGSSSSSGSSSSRGSGGSSRAAVASNSNNTGNNGEQRQQRQQRWRQQHGCRQQWWWQQLQQRQ